MTLTLWISNCKICSIYKRIFRTNRKFMWRIQKNKWSTNQDQQYNKSRKRLELTDKVTVNENELARMKNSVIVCLVL
jgi:hypothetical protein